MFEKKFSQNNESPVQEPEAKEKIPFHLSLRGVFCEKEDAPPQEVNIQIEQKRSRLFVNDREIKSTGVGSAGNEISFFIDGGGYYVCQLGSGEGQMSLKNYEKFLKIFRHLPDDWPPIRF